MATEQLTEACFLMRPAKRGRRAPDVDAFSFRPLFGGKERADSLAARFAAFRSTWEHVRALHDEELARLNARVCTDLLAFLSTPVASLPGGTAQPFREIRTALVCAGTSGGADQGVFFETAARELAELDERARVGTLDARNIRGMRQLVERASQALMGRDSIVDESDDDGADEDRGGGGGSEHTDALNGSDYDAAASTRSGARIQRRSHPLTLQGLASWYASLPAGSSLVLFVREFESLEPATFADFVSACSECYATLPLTLVLGVNTSPDILWRSLHGRAHSRLAKRTFVLDPPSVALDALVRRLLVEPSGALRLAAGPYEMVIEHFLQMDHSLRGFWRAVEYAVMDHYYANPLSVLCPPPELAAAEFDSWARDAKGVLAEDHINAVRRLPSFRALCESLRESEPARVRRVLTSDDAVRDEVPALLAGLWRFHARFRVGLALLTAVEAAVMRRTSSQRLLYFSALQQPLAEQPGVRRVVDLLPRLSGPALLRLLPVIMNDILPVFLADPVGQDSADEAVSQALRAAAAELQGSHSEALQLETDTAGLADDGDGDGEASGAATQGVLDLWAQNELAAARQMSRSRRSGSVLPPTAGLAHGMLLHVRRSKPLAAAVAALQEAVRAMLDHCLVHYSSAPLHELWYFSRTSALRKALHPQPRASLHTALSNPRHYLSYDLRRPLPAAASEGTPGRKRQRTVEDGDAHDDARADAAPGEDPDTCVLHRLYCESGRLINLYDLFVAFASSVDDRPTRDLEASAELRARFLRSLAEMHLMGFVKPTRRKPDHVMRLTWSGASSEPS